MSLPRVLGPTLSRPTVLLASRTSANTRFRFFSDTRRSHSREDPYDRLRSARPLVPDALANRFSQAGRSRNSRAFVVASAAAAVAFYFYNSQTVPVTGRRRFNFLSDALVARAHSRAVDQIVQQVEEQGGHFLSDWDPRTIQVKRVMKRLIPVSGMTDLDWEIWVIADNRTLKPIVMLTHILTLSRYCQRFRSSRGQGLCPQRDPKRLSQRGCSCGCFGT